MALTKISTDGVKDDAITKAKIPADQIEASELANDAVDTNAIQDDAVTEDKLANSINTAIAANTAKDLTALSASNLTSGTVPDARFPATLPAASAANLTSIPSANLTGALPAISGASLTNLPAGGKFASYAIICDQKSAGTYGGTTSTGSFLTRDLNTELADPDGIVSISSNRFTLQAGTYLIRGSAPANTALSHQTMVWNYTDSSVAVLGTSSYSHNGIHHDNRSFFTGRVTISGAKAFEIRHRVGAARATSGFGQASNYDLQPCIYTVVEIFKES